ncbi:MAG: hypothetical protein MUO23_03785, partial [Anaerolineales bacterium]|nr:hypothetical protein [Anaerolineales bacterium]
MRPTVQDTIEVALNGTIDRLAQESGKPTPELAAQDLPQGIQLSLNRSSRRIGDFVDGFVDLALDVDLGRVAHKVHRTADDTAQEVAELMQR